jgi:hypothetical protein
MDATLVGAMSISTQLLLTILTTTPTTDGARYLCDVVDRMTDTPTICRPHPAGAPIYDGKVCCAGSACVPASGGQCHERETLYHCELGELTVTGAVACWFEVPEYCDVFACDSQIAPPPLKIPVCCSSGVCWELDINANDCEISDIFWCSEGASNADGTVICLEHEN